MKKIKLLSLFAMLIAFSFSVNAQWTTSGTNIYNSNSGNVGIGTGSAAPLTKLHVNGDIYLPGFKALRFGSTTDSGNRLSMHHNSTAGQNIIDFQPSLLFRGGESGSRVNVMYLLSNGNVGIGLTNPSYKLHVNGDAKVNSNFRVGGTQYLPYGRSIIFGHETDKTKQFKIYYAEGSTSNPTGDAYIHTGGNLYFYTGASANPVALFNKNGDFHIGWSALKTSKKNLKVNGKITANEIEVKADVWADYVFADDYNLPSLKEVKSHIDANKHLPGIPSEKEALEKGVNVGDMQVKLLQKIEELTLYVIQQQEKIEGMEKEMNMLKEQKNN